MIIRIFRTIIHRDLRDEFEDKFQAISQPLVESCDGVQSVTIAKPTKSAPDEYVMISIWDSQASIEKFVGPDWNQAHIPAGMEHLIKDSWLHHYETF